MANKDSLKPKKKISFEKYNETKKYLPFCPFSWEKLIFMRARPIVEVTVVCKMYLTLIRMKAYENRH